MTRNLGLNPSSTSGTDGTFAPDVPISEKGAVLGTQHILINKDVLFVPGSRAAPVLGIDPGLAGAIAVVTPSGDLVDVFDMPTIRDGAKGRAAVNAPLLAAIIRETGATTAFVEFVGPRPGEGAVGAFAFGRCRGVIEGVAAALGVPVAFLTPPSWKRTVGIAPGKDGAKDAARAEAIRRWPSLASKFARVKDDGRAEAALIALAGMIREDRR